MTVKVSRIAASDRSMKTGAIASSATEDRMPKALLFKPVFNEPRWADISKCHVSSRSEEISRQLQRGNKTAAAVRT